MSPAVKRYVALGDSFSAGLDDGSTPWPELTVSGLRQRGERVELFNFARVNATTDEVAELQLEPALELGPALVSLVCGANDVLLSVRPDLAAFEATFDTILGRLRSELPETTLVTATYPDPGRFADLRPRTRRRVVEGIERANEVIRASARSYGALCLELSEHPGVADRANVGSDGFHPSAVGHRRAAAEVLEALADHRADERECA
ncbi:MAG: SGNH/GDSL hydrolase family protein [Thermoleophilaceae bacterium]